MRAPNCSRPWRCKLMGRAPMAHPPGKETRARPVRATSGPSTRLEARMVFTNSYGASDETMRGVCRAERAVHYGKVMPESRNIKILIKDTNEKNKKKKERKKKKKKKKKKK